MLSGTVIERIISIILFERKNDVDSNMLCL